MRLAILARHSGRARTRRTSSSVGSSPRSIQPVARRTFLLFRRSAMTPQMKMVTIATGALISSRSTCRSGSSRIGISTPTTLKTANAAMALAIQAARRARSSVCRSSSTAEDDGMNITRRLGRNGLGRCRSVPDDGAGAEPGSHGDVAAAGELRSLGAGGELAAGEDRAQDDLHLQRREAGAEAAPAAAAEGGPGVGARRGFEEALGAEGIGVGVDRRVVVQQVGADDERDAWRDRSSRRSRSPAW